jgi:molybdenum cofactor cytidylyltransferase
MIAAIVLAAGRSVRMGTQKLLLPIGGRPVIARVVDELRASPVDRILVVVGAAAERIQQALTTRAVTIVRNPEAQGDMLSSIRCGLQALPESCEGMLVVLGDQPGLTRGLVAELIRALRNGGRRVVVPVCAGERGHPLLFAGSLRNEVLTNYDGVGLCGLLAAHPADVLEVNVAVASELADMDTPEDYERLRASLDAGITPSSPPPPPLG